jgi:hypothetical protein
MKMTKQHIIYLAIAIVGVFITIGFILPDYPIHHRMNVAKARTLFDEFQKLYAKNADNAKDATKPKLTSEESSRFVELKDLLTKAGYRYNMNVDANGVLASGLEYPKYAL